MQGRNKETRAKILSLKRFATLEKANLSLKNEEIHPLVRSYYLGFVIAAFVDDAIEESGTHIDNIPLAFVSLELKK